MLDSAALPSSEGAATPKRDGSKLSIGRPVLQKELSRINLHVSWVQRCIREDAFSPDQLGLDKGDERMIEKFALHVVAEIETFHAEKDFEFWLASAAWAMFFGTCLGKILWGFDLLKAAAEAGYT